MANFAFMLVLSLATLANIRTAWVGNGNIRNPVILVPGDGGSQFEAKLTNKPSTVHYWCTKNTDYWFSLWLNLELMAPYILDCTVDNLRLVYDNETHTTSNSPGVQVRVPGFGNTSSVEWLDPSQIGPTAYFNPIVNRLVTLGHKRDVTIRGAPYDFRKAPNENMEFVNNLQKLVEETYKINGNTPVIMIGHSMGNLYTLFMLNRQSQAWKNKYIKSYISLAGPWGGAAKIMKLFASGDNLGVFIVNPLSARPEQRSMTSSAWLMPSDLFWSEDEVLVYGPKGNYTVRDYEKFFKDLDYPVGYMMRKDTEMLLKDLKPPGVEVHCLHGVNVSTPAVMKYSEKQWYDLQPDTVFGDGDGTVNLRSLLGCLRWQGKQSQKVYHKVFPNVDHMQILGRDPVIDYIQEVVTAS